jgi:hypothetical protein
VGDIAVGAGIGVLVAGSVGCAVGAQPIKTRLATTPPNIILIAKNVLLIRVFIIFLLELDVITEQLPGDDRSTDILSAL